MVVSLMKNFQIFIIFFKIYGIAEVESLQVFGPLFYRRKKKFVVGISVYAICKLKSIKKFVFYLWEKLSD